MQKNKVGISYGIKAVKDEKAELDKSMKDVDADLYVEKRKKGRAQKKPALYVNRTGLN